MASSCASALVDMRRSAGRLTGLPLALFASLCLPLLLPNLFATLALGSLLLLIVRAFSPPGGTVLLGAPEMLLSALPCLAIDFLIARAAWRYGTGPQSQATPRSR